MQILISSPPAPPLPASFSCPSPPAPIIEVVHAWSQNLLNLLTMNLSWENQKNNASSLICLSIAMAMASKYFGQKSASIAKKSRNFTAELPFILPFFHIFFILSCNSNFNLSKSYLISPRLNSFC